MALLQSDRDNLANLANGSNVAYTAGALRPAANIATSLAQMNAAVTYWTNVQSGGGLTANQSTAVADAIAHLGRLAAYYQSPATAAFEPIR